MTLPATKQMTPIEEIRGSLTKMVPQFKMALPSHITPEKFMRVVVTAVQLDNKLLSANRQSLYSAAMAAAQDGLLPDKKEGVITTYGDQAVWMPMVGGMCKKARNSGEISTIDAVVVYENDEYEAWTDEKGSHFKHVKARGDRGNAQLTYAYAITKDGGFFFEEIDEKQMSEIEKKSKTPTIWKGPFKDEQRRKSALRRLLKYRTPSSTDIDQMIDRENEQFAGLNQAPVDAKPEEPKTNSSRLSKIVEAVAVKEQPVATSPVVKEPDESPLTEEEEANLPI